MRRRGDSGVGCPLLGVGRPRARCGRCSPSGVRGCWAGAGAAELSCSRTSETSLLLGGAFTLLCGLDVRAAELLKNQPGHPCPPKIILSFLYWKITNT